MHKSQGFGSAKQRGESFEYFKPIKGDTTGLKDIFEGVDFTWKRVEGGEKIGKQITKILKDYKVENPSSSKIDLEKLKLLFESENVSIHQDFLRKIVFNSCGIVKEAIVEKTNYSLNEKFNLVKQTIVRTTNYTKGYKFNNIHFDTTKFSSNEISQPYWLVNPIKKNMFVIQDKYNLLRNSLTFPYTFSSFNFETSSNSFKYIEHIQYKWVDPEKGELYRPLVITPPVMINLTQKSFVFTDLNPKEIQVIVKAGKDNVKFDLKINADGWEVLVPNQSINYNGAIYENQKLTRKGQDTTYTFLLIPTKNSTNDKLEISAIVDGVEYTKGIKEIKYDHIPVQTWFPEAEAKLVKVDVKKTFNTVGYIQGAGDAVPASLEQMGYKVVMITDEQLQHGNLNEFPAIVLGVRAFNTNEKLQQYKQRVFDYVKEGGNLIVQYNTNSFFGPLKDQISPVPFKLSRDRVTIEEAPVTFLLPEHPVLNFPNKITNSDFDGWIQERGIYFGTDMDSSYQCPLSMNDPGEKPNKGSLIIAKYGKGNYIYTGLAFFRELSAGVPGAYRLFANILSLETDKKFK
jgi:hypothetical protein